MIYLFSEDGMMTGESFHSWDEVMDFLQEQLGELDFKTRMAAKNGRHIKIGSKHFVFIPEGMNEEAVA